MKKTTKIQKERYREGQRKLDRLCKKFDQLKKVWDDCDLNHLPSARQQEWCTYMDRRWETFEQIQDLKKKLKHCAEKYKLD